MGRTKKTDLTDLEQRLAAATTQEEIEAIERDAGIAPQRPQLIVRTLQEVADIVGMTLQTVKSWRIRAEDPMPGREGAWDIVAILLWNCERLRRAATVNQKSPAKEAAELRIAEADAFMREIKARKAAGTLADKAVVTAKIAEIFNQVRIEIEAIPTLVSVVVPPDFRADVTQEIRQQIFLILRKMAARANEPMTKG